jgi:hypothetical protein
MMDISISGERCCFSALVEEGTFSVAFWANAAKESELSKRQVITGSLVELNFIN